MPHPLLQKFAQLRRHLTWLQGGRALGWALVVIVFAALLLAWLDYSFRYHDRGLRYLQSAALAAVVVLAIRKWIWPLRRKPSEIQLAAAVSERFGLPPDQLTSALDFLTAEAETVGESPALRRSVIHAAWAEVEPLDFRQAVDTRPCRAALLAALGVFVLLLILGAARPGLAWAGAARLLFPWSNRAWPQQHELEFRDLPTKLARGQALRGRVIDRRGRLPEHVTVHLDYDSGETETLRISTADEVARLEHPGPTDSFWIWAEGGDDRMQLGQRIDVVEPPAVAELQTTLHPPEYLGLQPAKSERALRAVVGTRVEIEGESDWPIVSAEVVLDDGARYPLPVEADRRTFRSSPNEDEVWRIAGSGAYHIELRDSDGVVGRDAEDWAIQAIPDEAPDARLSVAGTASYATPEAELQLLAVAEDDWDLQDLGVEARVTAGNNHEITIVPGREWPLPPRSPAELPPAASAVGEFAANLKISDLRGAAPGTTLNLAAVAHDRRPVEGRSSPHKLAIVTREEFLARFEAEMGRALADLQRIFTLQDTAQQRLASVLSATAKRVTESLATVARDQAIVRRQLVQGPQSVLVRARQLSGVLTANGLVDSESGRRLAEVAETLESLETGLLPGLAGDTATVAREVSLDPAALRPARLAELQGRQQTVLDALGPLVGALQGWELLQQLAAQLAAVAEEERVMAAASADLAPSTLGRAREELSAEEAGRLEQRTSEQRRLTRRFAALEQRLAALSGELPTSDAPLLARLEAALAQAAGLAIGSQMQAAAADLEVNRPARAAEVQRQAATDIDALVDTLRGVRPAADDAAVQSLAELQARQAALAAEMAAAQNPQQLAELAKRQAALQQSLRSQASSLSSAAAKAAAAASQAMSAAAKAARANQPRPAAQAAQKAAEQLQAAANSQSPAANGDPTQKLRERALQLRDAQQLLFERTRMAEAASAPVLANDQAQLRGQVDGLSQASGKAPVVQYALGQVSSAMARAVDLLEQADPGPATQQAQSEAIERLTQLANSLEREAPPPQDGQKPPPPPQNGPGQAGNPPPPPGDPLLLAELKLVRQWQQTIQEKFAKLSAGNDARALGQLKDEQQRLAELAKDVAGRAAQAAAPPLGP